MPLLANILLLFSSLLLAVTAENSCSSCFDYTRTPETNGSTVVETVIRLIQHSGIFTDDYGALQRIAWLETQYGQNQLTYRPWHDGGIWNINQTGFSTLNVSSQHVAMIQNEFCFNWNEVVWTDLRKPLYSALAARLLIHQLSSGGVVSQDTSTQAQMWLNMYTNMDRTQSNYVDIDPRHNSTSNKVNISNIDIGTTNVCSLCTNEYVYFSYNISTDVPLIKVSLVTNGSASLYISNAGPPSESFYCAKIEETSSTGYVYVSVDQLSSCGSQEMLFISVVGTERSGGMTAVSLILSNANDSYEFIQNTGSDSDWFAIGMYSNHPDVGSIPISIFVTSDSDSAFNISIESYEGVILSGEVKPYETSEFFVPETYMVSNESDYMNGLIVRADDGNRMRVSVSNHYYISSDSYLALPLIKYQGVTEYTYFAVTPNFTSPNLTSRILIVCGFNDTSITINSTQTAYMYLPSGVETLQPSTPMTISGNMYQTILIESEDQLMGTKVVTDKPVTFLSGHQCASLPDNISCDFAIEQIPPTINWGKNFIFPLLSSRVGGSYLSILASESDTTVEVSCTNSNGTSTLSDSFSISSSGDYATMLVAPDDALCSVISSKPTLLTVLSTSNNYDTTEGDPLMVLVQPVEQYVNVNHSFTAFKSDIDNHYLNLMVKASSDDLNNIQLNDEAISTDWKSINTTGGVRAGYMTQLNVANTTHSVSVRSASSGGDLRVGGMMYGFACSVGYGQLIATNLYLIHETTNRLAATITNPPQQQQIIGNNVKLTCTTSGLPVYALHWRRGGSRVYPSCKHSISSNSPGSSVLTIYNASEADDGMYECVAHSYYSDPMTATSQALSLVSPSTDHYSIPTITPTETSTWALKNESRSLSFNISNGVPSITSNHVWWYFEPLTGKGRYLDPNTTTKYIFSSDHLSINVTGSELSDSGNYTLTVRNEVGLANSTIAFNVYIAPRIDTIPRNVTKNGSESVTFNCTADGYPRPSITWTKDNVAVSEGNLRFRITPMDLNPLSETKQIMSSLTITDLIGDDSGNYLCRASSLEVPREAVLEAPFNLNVIIIERPNYCANNPCQNGGTCISKQSTFSCLCDDGYTGNACQDKLIVYKAPQFTETPQGVVGEYFSPVNLTCKAIGSPTPVILWYKDNVELNNTNDDSSVLKIPELRLSSRGYYYCVARVTYNGDKSITSKQVLINIKGIVQYAAIIAAPNTTDSQTVEQQVRNSLNNENFMGNTEVLQVKAKTQNSRKKRSTTNYEIIITLRTDMEPSDSLRKSIEDQINAASSSSGIRLSQQIDRFDGCKSDMSLIPPHTNRTNISVTIEWPESNLGDDVRVRCPCGDQNASSLMATRSCRGNFNNGGLWEEAYVVPCNFSDFAREICELTELAVPERVEGLNNLTSDGSFNLDSTDVAVVTLVLLTTTDDVKGNEMLTRSYLEVVDNIIAIEPIVLIESQNASNTSSRILNTIDTILSELPVPNVNEPVIITFDRLAASAIKIDTTNFEGLVFASDVNGSNIGDPQYSSSDNVTTGGTVSITLPENLLDSVNTTGTIQVINKVFIDDILFLRRDNKSLDVNSAIVSAAIVDTPIQGLENSINISFPMGKGNISKQSCAFWNFSLDGGYGDWSPQGCVLVVVDDKSVCLCDHLTNFALLLDVSKEEHIPEDDRPIDFVLEAVTYIGIIISIVCILLTLFTYIVAKKLRKRSSGQLIINLCLALLFLYLSFILAVHSRKYEALCAISALILQYFFLVTFLAMGCESVILYRELVIIVGERKYGVALKAALVCWILPLLVVGFCFAPNYNHYVHKAFCRAFDVPFYIGTVAPFILIYIFNSIVFTIIIISLLKRGQSSATKLPGHMYVKQQLGVAISLSVLFGITWGLGLFASNSIYNGNERHIRDAFAALFVILTTFHGLGLFVMHCVRPAKVREEVKAIFIDRSKRTTRTSGTGGIQKERMTAASKNAGYTAVTIDKRSSYSMHPTDSIRDSTASLKKNEHGSFAISNSFAVHEEETGFAANPNFVAEEDSPEMTPVKKFQDEKFEAKEDSNSSTGSYASNDNHPIMSTNGTPVEQ